MTLIALTTPEPFVTLAEVKDYLRVDGEQSDPELSAHIATACGELDGVRSIINRAVMQQTLRLELPALTGAVALPRPPLISVTSVVVTGPGGDEVEPDLLVMGLGDEFREAIICPAAGTNWPVSSGDPGSVVITYEAGYEPVGGDDRAGIPPQFKTAAFVRVAQLYDRDERAAAVLDDHRRSLIDALTAHRHGGY